MARVARRITDERVLKLIRRFLEAGMMADGLTQPRKQGTPQGGPLTPWTQKITLVGLPDFRGSERARCPAVALG